MCDQLLKLSMLYTWYALSYGKPIYWQGCGFGCSGRLNQSCEDVHTTYERNAHHRTIALVGKPGIDQLGRAYSYRIDIPRKNTSYVLSESIG